MSAALLDVNVLIALLDRRHPNSDDAHVWFAAHHGSGWATCPITINGCLRILSRPGYSEPQLSAPEVAGYLRALCQLKGHIFWPEDVNLLDQNRFNLNRIQGPRQLTDILLLGLAVEHGAKLVTIDRSIPWQAVVGAKKSDLNALGGLVS